MAKTKKEKADLSGLSLADISKHLQKRYGKESVVLFNERPPKIDVISTGSLRLNKALGVGGLPRGRIVEFYGPPMAGKCLPASTYVATAQGLMTIREIMQLHSMEEIEGFTGLVERKIQLLNQAELYEETKAFVYNGKKPLLRIKTQSGHSIDCTPNHPHKVFELYDQLQWREASAIKPGNLLVCPRNNNYTYGNSVTLHNVFYVLGSMLKNPNTPVSSSLHLDLANNFYAVTKSVVQDTVPVEIRMFPKNIVAEFIKGFLDVDGHFTENSEFMVRAGNRTALYQIKLILQIYFGVISFLSQQQEGWKLIVDKNNLTVLYNKIGTARKDLEQGYLKAFKKIEDTEEPPRDDDPIIEILNGADHKYYSRINVPISILRANHFYDRVVSVEEIPADCTYDFEMEYSHSFVANGIVTHNTTVALHAIAEAQKKGGLAAFIDAEHSLDKGMAKGTGVQEDKLILSQPTSGEEGLAILEDIVKSKSVAIAVVDSVAALVPKAELDGEMTDQQMGAQARMMGKALRKLTGVVAKSNTLVIFINQIRQKMQSFGFGTPETTSGGLALKFLASVRLDIRAIGQIKQKDRVIGNKVKIKITKNKVAAPFEAIETNIIFGRGFYKELELLEEAIEQDVVDQEGSKIKYCDVVLGKGIMAASAVLEQDKNLYKAILTDIRNKGKAP